MIFFDTNLLVAASVPKHAHHKACHQRLARIRESGGACAAHSMAEAFSVLTRLPLPYRLPASEAIRVIEYTKEYAALVSLSETETFDVLRSLASRNLGGGVTYDALMMACARKIDAHAIYTYNVRHFRQVAPDSASRIVEP